MSSISKVSQPFSKSYAQIYPHFAEKVYKFVDKSSFLKFIDSSRNLITGILPLYTSSPIHTQPIGSAHLRQKIYFQILYFAVY